MSFFFRRLFRSIGRLFKRVFRAAARVIRVALRSPIVRAIVQIAGTAIAATLTAGAAVPFITAAISSGLSAASGGSLVDSLKAAAFSFAQVHVWSVVGASIEGLQALGQSGFAAAKGAIHGVVGGAIAAAQGGNFLQGFAANAIGAVAGVASQGTFGFAGDGNFDLMIARTAIAAIAGCAGASISGGKCANGAITAGMAHLFNAESLLYHERSTGPGHTIRSHVGKSNAQLLRLMRPVDRGVYWEMRREASTFNNLTSAEKLINSTLDSPENAGLVAQVAAGNIGGETLQKTFRFVTGKQAFRTRPNAFTFTHRPALPPVRFRKVYSVRVIIRHDPQFPNGFQIVTGFPTR